MAELPEGGVAARAALEELAAELGERHAAGERSEALVLAWLQAVVALAESAAAAEEREALWAEADLAAAASGVLENGTWVAWRRALAERDEGLFGLARERLEQALASVGERTSPLAPWILLDLAALARHRGAWSDALELLDRADARLAAPAADEAGRALVRTALSGERAQTWIDLGLPDRAAPWIEREAEGVRATADPFLRSAHLVHLANLRNALEDHGAVLDLVREAREGGGGAALSAAQEAQLDVRLGIALGEAARSDPAQAAEARRALGRALAEPRLLAPERFTALITWADLELRAGATEEAASQLAAARELVRGWRAADAFRAPIAELAQLAALEGRLALAQGLTGAALAPRLEALRAAHAAFLEQWGDTPERAGGLGYLCFSDRRDVLADLVRLELSAGDPDSGSGGVERALEALARTQALGTLARSLNLPAPDPAQLRGLVRGPEHLVVAPLLAPSGSFVLWLGGGTSGARCARLLPQAQLDELRLSFVAALAAGRTAREEGAALVAALVPAELVAALAGARALTLVGAGELGPLPLEAAPVPPALAREPGETFGERFAIDRVPSLPVGLELLRRAAEPAPARAGVLAATEPAPAARARFAHLVPLDFGPADAARITAPYAALPGAAEPWLRLGRAASATSLAEAREPALGVLHVLAHGVFDPRRELPAALALHAEGSEGLLGCDEVARLSAAPLVVLASCGAARGPRRPGEDGVEHLGGAFLRGGARCVVLSSFDLDDRTSRELFVDLHQGVARGLSPAEALRDARRALARRTPSHAGLAGLVQVLGSGQEPLFPAAAARGPGALATGASPSDAMAGASGDLAGVAGPVRLALGAGLAAAALVLVLRRRAVRRPHANPGADPP